MKLLVFDIDGTLIDSQELIFSAFRMALESHGMEVPTKSKVLKGVGLSLFEAVKTLYPLLSEDKYIAIVHSYRDSFAKLRKLSSPGTKPVLFPGVIETLKILNSHGDFLLSIATGKSKIGVENDLITNGIFSFFKNIQTSDDHASKPDPSMLKCILQETRMPPSSAVMIGDTTFDMEMAKALNLKTIGVSWGYHSVSDLSYSGADYIIDSMFELKKAIDQIFSRDFK